MAYSICIIDDGINQAALENDIENNGVLNSLCLEKLIKEKEAWGDEVSLFNLFRMLLDEKEDDDSPQWKVYGFAHPALFVRAFEEDLFRTEFIVFDWDYDIQVNHKDVLKQIFESTYSVVGIFSGADKQDEIEDILGQDEFAIFKNRWFYLDKNNEIAEGTDGPSKLIIQAKKFREESFSFRFGTELRSRSLEALDKVLVELGKVNIDETVNYFEFSEDKNRDLIDFIAERFRNSLVESPFEELPEGNQSGSKTNDDENEIVRNLWSQRLYYYNHDSNKANKDNKKKDKYVRKGDIIKKGKEFFVVITPDCDLQRHWHKNYGYINLLPIYDIEDNSSKIKIKGKLDKTRTNKDVKKNLKVSSFSNPMSFGEGGPLALPFLMYEGEVRNFIAFPKEITGSEIEIPKDMENDKVKLKEKSLIYGETFDYERIATISEPFLTPFIQKVFSTLSGFGTPNYPETVQNIIKSDLKEMLNKKEN